LYPVTGSGVFISGLAMATKQKLTFVRQWRPCDGRIVWVDIAMIDASWREDEGYYIAPGQPTTFGWWLWRFQGRRIPMPHLGLHPEEGFISFTDGRNRFAWFRDHGVKAIPITVATRKEEKIIRKRFGSRRRMVRIDKSLFLNEPGRGRRR
jgi:hypothetical protein